MSKMYPSFSQGPQEGIFAVTKEATEKGLFINGEGAVIQLPEAPVPLPQEIFLNSNDTKLPSMVFL